MIVKQVIRVLQLCVHLSVYMLLCIYAYVHVCMYNNYYTYDKFVCVCTILAVYRCMWWSHYIYYALCACVCERPYVDCVCTRIQNQHVCNAL